MKKSEEERKKAEDELKKERELNKTGVAELAAAQAVIKKLEEVVTAHEEKDKKDEAALADAKSQIEALKTAKDKHLKLVDELSAAKKKLNDKLEEHIAQHTADVQKAKNDAADAAALAEQAYQALEKKAKETKDRLENELIEASDKLAAVEKELRELKKKGAADEAELVEKLKKGKTGKDGSCTWKDGKKSCTIDGKKYTLDNGKAVEGLAPGNLTIKF